MRGRASVPTLLPVVVALASCTSARKKSEQPPAPPVAVGVILPGSGPMSDLGASAGNGMRLAEASINEGGGLLGRKLKLEFRDDHGTKAGAESAVKQLLAETDRRAVIGGLADGAARAIAAACQEKGVPFVAPFATDPAIAATGSQAFSIAASDAEQGAAAARYACYDLRAATAAVFPDSTSTSSQTLADAFSDAFEAAGGKIVARVRYGIADTEFAPVLAFLRDTPLDVAYAPGFQPAIAMLAQQARQEKIRATFLGADGWLVGPPTTGDAGIRAPDGYVTAQFAADAPWTAAKAFAEAYQAKYDGAPDAFAALGYDAVRLIADAIRRAGKDDPAAVRAALAETSGFEGATGAFDMAEGGTARKTVLILRVRGGRTEFAKAIHP